ncbi:MAG: SUMF1/EgtB/PvdO family nonheme iron enzyme [Bythopirellula sp.]|nr:SUMF1/EgtB/PvdO family nonheme iron enzyme [Bythopirellula sp.]
MKLISLLALLLAVVTILSAADRAVADTFGSGANTFDIEFVTIGNPGNRADTTGAPNPAGSVPYTYRMGKFEISEQMIDKANAEGNLGITKGSLGANKPATFVTWNEAARFINWLNVASGSTPAYKFALQPGEAGYSANSGIQLWAISDPGYNPNNLFRNSLAKYFLPNVDEWYKAAYFDPSAGRGSVYYLYPTGNFTAPDGLDFAGDTIFEAVFNQGGSNNDPNDITNVGVLSPYGTAGQGGNVFEWEETDFDLVNGPISSLSPRGVRGGSWYEVSSTLLATRRFDSHPTFETADVGFRVASIPEPSTLLLGVLASAGMLWRRRR